MLQYYTEDDKYPLTDYDDFSIKHRLDGNEDLSFILPTNSPHYARIGEETQIDYGDNEWLVKKIDDDKFDCSLNFDFLKTRAYCDYKSETKPLAYVLEQHLPNGWLVIGANISSISRTIEFDVCTDYDVIYKCMDTYSVYFVWKIKQKKLYVYSQSATVYGVGGTSSNYAIRLYAYGKNGLTLEKAIVDGTEYGLKYIDSIEGAENYISITWTDESYTSASSLYTAAKAKVKTLSAEVNAVSACGEYITEELNLRALSFKGDSTEFATRIYAYGADGLTLEEAIIDGERYGLTYIDNNQYATKTVCVVFKDERYTTANGLYDAASEKLAEKAFPTRSYECSVDDLAKQNSSFAFLEFKMHYKAVLLDKNRKTRVEHKVVEYLEYPDEPSRNVVTLSCTAGTIQSYVKGITTGIHGEVEEVDNSLNNKVMMQTALLLSAWGGHVFELNGELFIADNENLYDAEVVWRFNINGWGKSSTGVYGPYTTAMTVNDEFTTSIINAMVIRGSYIEADSIQATHIKQSYTDGVLKSSFEAAEGLVKSTFEDYQKLLSNEEGTGELDIVKSRLTTIQETIDGWEATFQEQYRGGINSIMNSAGLNGLAYWDTYNTSGIGGLPYTVQGDITNGYTVSNSAFVLRRYNYMQQKISNLIIGSSYSLSCKIKRTSSSRFQIEMGHFDAESGAYINDKTLLSTSYSDSNYDWQTISLTIDSLERTEIVLRFKNIDNALIYLSDIMLVEGKIAHSWTPAPDEIYTNNTKIDKNGVTVSNKEALRKTCMTYEEFAGYYNDEEVFSLNGDETHTKNTFVDGQLIIAKTDNTDRKGVIIIPFNDGNNRGIDIAVLD